MNKIFAILIAILSFGCSLNNRVEIIDFQVELLEDDTLQRKPNYNFLGPYKGKNQVIIAFIYETKFVTDGTKQKKWFTYQPEGVDGPVNSINTITILLSDSSRRSILDVSNLLYNDSSYYRFQTSVKSIGSKSMAIKIPCEDSSKFNCYCRVTNIYQSIDNFISNYNSKKRSVCSENLKTPILWSLNIELEKISEYDFLIVEIKFDDGTSLKKEVNIP